MKSHCAERLPGLVAGVLLLGSLLPGCSGDSPIGVNNVSPGGSVGGVVLDGATLKPLAGVAVSVIAGARRYPESATQSDAAGRFAIDGVPSGSMLVAMTPPITHQAIVVEATMPSAAGDFPLANAIVSIGPIALLPLATPESAFRVQLVTPDGAPAPNIKAHLRTQVAWVDLGGGDPAGMGSAFVEAASDGTGALRFTGMPDVVRVAGMVGTGTSSISDTVRVIVPPFDSNKDNVLDFYGKEQAFQLLKLGGAVPTIVLSSTPPALQVLASNIATLTGKTGNRALSSTSGPLFVTFSAPLVSKLTEVTVFDERGGELPSAAKATINANLLTVKFDGLQEGSEYNVNIRAVATIEGSLVEAYYGAAVFTPSKPGKVQVVSLKRNAAAPGRVQVTFSEPIGLAIAGQPMTGAYSVMFFNADLNGSGVIGDAPGERGATATALGLAIDEVQPPGAAGLSWMSRYWTFDLPLDPLGVVIPANTGFDFGFTLIAAGTVQRGDGTPVNDLLNLVVPTAP